MENWDDLRFFLAAARGGSSRAAARELSVNQSTVARRLAQLEENGGVRLFERRARGLTLTDAGREILRDAENIERSFAAVDRRILGRDTRLTGSVVVSLPDGLAEVLAPVLADFVRLYPGIQIDSIINNGLLDLSLRQADVVVRLSSSPPDHLIGRRIGKAVFAAYGSAAHVLGSPLPGATDDHDWVRWGEPWRAMPLERWIDANVDPSRVRAVVNSSIGMSTLVAQGIGLGFSLCLLADTDPRLVRVGPRHDFGLSLWLLTHDDIRNTARIDAFMAHVSEATMRWRPAMEGPWPEDAPRATV